MNKIISRKYLKGSVLIFICLAMPVLLAFMGLSIDIGYVAIVRNQLQVTADAAALAAAANVSNSSTAISSAQNYANLNYPNHGTVLASSDVLIGIWNTSTNTFSTTSSNPNAVQVTVRQTQAAGNPVKLFFMPIVGITQANVTATATAMQSYPSLNYGIVGLSSITMSGGSSVDSYNSTQGAYSSSSATHNGNIASNGSININNGANVYGSANQGVGQSLTIAPGSTVTGATGPLSSALSFPSLSPPTNYNNNGLGSSLNASAGGTTVSLTAGTYYFTSFSVSNGVTLSVSGPATVYVSGSLTLSGGGIINTSTNPHLLSIFLTSAGTSVNISNNGAFYGLIYAPNAAISLMGGSGIYGGVIGASINISNGAAIHRDSSLLESFMNPTIYLVN